MNKLKTRSHHDAKLNHIHFYAPEGVEVMTYHSEHIDSEGNTFLKADKPYAIRDLIQSHKEECDINKIIKRALEGDYNALNQTVGIYTDITAAPKTLAEAQQMLIDLENKFDELPADIKAKFEYSKEKYIAEFGSDSWAEKVGYKEALEKENARLEQAAKTEQYFADAIEHLATGEITVKGENVNDQQKCRKSFRKHSKSEHETFKAKKTKQP